MLKQRLIEWQEANPAAAHEKGHRRLEGLATVFTILAVIAILVGSVIELYPTLNVTRYLNPTVTTVPYTPLELAGRDLYVAEGCYVCHSQQVRKTPDDVLRFGAASQIEDSLYDHPFQWGSRRTGPDLSHLGKKYPNLWHLRHMADPRSVTSQSLMPNYPWLLEKKIDFASLRKKVSVMKYLGVPYDEKTLVEADVIAQNEAKEIASQLVKDGAPAGLEDRQIVALIAYLQSLGQKTQPAGAGR